MRSSGITFSTCQDRPARNVIGSRAELVKGFEYERDRYVVVEDDELDQMAPPSSRVMEVREFVPTAEVDPVYLDASYYVVPEAARNHDRGSPCCRLKALKKPLEEIGLSERRPPV